MSGSANDCGAAEPTAKGSRIAFFGGSFDPPHLGHLAVARAARAAFQLDQVLFAPVGAQPLKPEGPEADFADRVAMTRLAIEDEPGFNVSLADAPRPDGAPNFTLETLMELRARLGSGGVLFCLVGADSFLSLRRWHRAAEVPFVAPLIVASRPGEPLDTLQDSLPPELQLESTPGSDNLISGVEIRTFELSNRAGGRAPFYVLPGLDVRISATEVRNEIRAGGSLAHDRQAQVPAAVAEYVRAHRLYR
jgi:nicotinate-nucleotide adenylyltransferase